MGRSSSCCTQSGPSHWGPEPGNGHVRTLAEDLRVRADTTVSGELAEILDAMSAGPGRACGRATNTVVSPSDARPGRRSPRTRTATSPCRGGRRAAQRPPARSAGRACSTRPPRLNTTQRAGTRARPVPVRRALDRCWTSPRTAQSQAAGAAPRGNPGMQGRLRRASRSRPPQRRRSRRYVLASRSLIPRSVSDAVSPLSC